MSEPKVPYPIPYRDAQAAQKEKAKAEKVKKSFEDALQLQLDAKAEQVTLIPFSTENKILRIRY